MDEGGAGAGGRIINLKYHSVDGHYASLCFEILKLFYYEISVVLKRWRGV